MDGYVIKNTIINHHDPDHEVIEKFLMLDNLSDLKRYIKAVADNWVCNILRFKSDDPEKATKYLDNVVFDMELDDFSRIHLFCEYTFYEKKDPKWPYTKSVDIRILNTIHMNDQLICEMENSYGGNQFSRFIELGNLMNQLAEEKRKKANKDA